MTLDIKEIHISNKIMLNADALFIIADFIRNRAGESLERVYLLGQELSEKSLSVALPTFMASLNQLPHLRNLVMCNCQLTVKFVPAITYYLHTCPRLDSLDLSNNDLTDDAMALLCKALLINKTLVQLDVARNLFTDGCCSAVASLLTENQTLTVLSLDDNHLGSIGVDLIANALPSNSTLTKLRFRSCGFDVVGVASISAMLKFNNTLLEIDLSGNSIDSQGAKILSRALCQNTTLTTLMLDDCPLADSGVVAILDSLHSNTRSAIEHLSFDNVGVLTDVAVLAVVKLVRASATLDYISMICEETTISDGVWAAIVRMIRLTETLHNFYINVTSASNVSLALLHEALLVNVTLDFTDFHELFDDDGDVPIVPDRISARRDALLSGTIAALVTWVNEQNLIHVQFVLSRLWYLHLLDLCVPTDSFFRSSVAEVKKHQGTCKSIIVCHQNTLTHMTFFSRS
jgi:Ran GTPase-activating protein (RanGAP) involved in mRNA processing and transport